MGTCLPVTSFNSPQVSRLTSWKAFFFFFTSFSLPNVMFPFPEFQGDTEQTRHPTLTVGEIEAESQVTVVVGSVRRSALPNPKE